MPPARRANRQDHQAFCMAAGWELRRTARGRTGTHHENYELPLPDGRILYTRISHPVNREVYGPSLFSHMLRDQLRVSAREFWDCVDNGVRPNRGKPPHPEMALPLELVNLLRRHVGLTEPEIARLTKSEAVGKLTEFYTQDSQRAN